MWKISKENCEDLGFAIICMFYDALHISEFKLWLDIVVRDAPIDKIPLYIFDLIDFDKNEEAIIAACDTCHKCRLNICSDSDKYPSVSKR